MISVLTLYGQESIFYKYVTRDLMYSNSHFICMPIILKGKKKILIIESERLAGLLNVKDSVSSAIADKYIYNKLVNHDTIMLDSMTLIKLISSKNIFDFEEHTKFHRKYLNNYISTFDKKDCGFKNKKYLEINYRENDWYLLIYKLWNKKVMTREDDETGFLDFYCP